MKHNREQITDKRISQQSFHAVFSGIFCLPAPPANTRSSADVMLVVDVTPAHVEARLEWSKAAWVTALLCISADMSHRGYTTHTSTRLLDCLTPTARWNHQGHHVQLSSVRQLFDSLERQWKWKRTKGCFLLGAGIIIDLQWFGIITLYESGGGGCPI